MPSTNGHTTNPERVALYMRVSSEEQREAGTIQTQRYYLGRYAAERGFGSGRDLRRRRCEWYFAPPRAA